MPGGVRQAAAGATGAPAPVARPPCLDGVNLLASFRGRRNGSDLLSFPNRTCPAWATFRKAGFTAGGGTATGRHAKHWPTRREYSTLRFGYLPTATRRRRYIAVEVTPVHWAGEPDGYFAGGLAACNRMVSGVGCSGFTY